MSQKETDILFEHTRRLRAHYDDSDGDAAGPRGKKKYAFVRRKEKPRAEDFGEALQDIMSSDDPKVDQAFLASQGDRSRAGAQKTESIHTTRSKSSIQIEEARDIPFERAIITFNPDLRVPPFFAWPALGDAGGGRKEDSHAIESSSSATQHDTTQIDCTLFVVAKHIYPRRNNYGSL